MEAGANRTETVNCKDYEHPMIPFGPQFIPDATCGYYPKAHCELELNKSRFFWYNQKYLYIMLPNLLHAGTPIMPPRVLALDLGPKPCGGNNIPISGLYITNCEAISGKLSKSDSSVLL